ncbi:hypothetical protein SAMN04487928_10876 [Butyrivibrio proteoclasticus]|uniref:Uncharacterized protein n=1 Tax=Butyrivibrio proteoclasticus TaxID=43305 RepID=A0A1I5T938_9FIRM|nr:hypothetical protein [Butyrivibrio proteoclasticus]SFP79550.1 hypothetical protein SAMN04487928_10876 [Butyrivibrio proteoclasticus]
MRRSAKTKTGMSQSCIAIMTDAIKAKEQNLSYGKFKALDMLGSGNMQDEEEESEYTVHTTDLVRRTKHVEEKKPVAFVKIRA